MSSDYDSLARDYHWLVPDELLAEDFFVTQHQALLRTIPPGSLVLDCACGIGRDAIALARAGYQSSASPAPLTRATLGGGRRGPRPRRLDLVARSWHGARAIWPVGDVAWVTDTGRVRE